MLTLKNFELQINDTIIHRGREYYENGAVVDMDEIEEGCWHAEVKGSERYAVEITLLKKNKINSYFCDCPYDGEICKHVVAVLFLLREQLANATAPQKTSSKTDFRTLLQKISLEEYRDFILAHATRDKNFKSLFERHFADKDSSINIDKNYSKLLKSLIRSKSSGNFIDYRSINQLANEINGLLDEGQQLIQKGNFRNAFVLIRSILTELIELITYCDDSSGYIGDIIYASIDMIAFIIATEGLAAELLEEIFDFVQSAVNSPVYFDYGDFGYNMADIYRTLAIKLSKAHFYLDFINGQIKRASADSYSYRKDYFLVRKIDFLRATGNSDDAEKLVRQNLDVVDVRRGEVSNLIKRNDLHAAKALIAEGIEIARKKGHPGTVAEWEKELLHIAILENDKNTIRHYTKHFAFDRSFDLAYYNQWKATFAASEWEEEIEKYIEEKITRIELQYQKNKSKVWHSPYTLLLDSLAPIYIEEKYWDRLLSLMSQETDLDRLLQYHHHLVKIYPVQLLALYLPAFERRGDIVSNRREYADLAIKMKMVMEAIPEGKAEIIDVAKELNRKYSRRPAMVEVLTKLIS